MHFCATGMMHSIAVSNRAMPSRSDIWQDLIYPNDAECLSHLTDITCKDREDLMGFTLEFRFDTNPYFTNTVLTKTYETANLLDHLCTPAVTQSCVYMTPELTAVSNLNGMSIAVVAFTQHSSCGEPLLESVKGTEIQWHPKKNLCEKTVKQKAGKPRGRNAQPQRVTVKTKKPNDSNLPQLDANKANTALTHCNCSLLLPLLFVNVTLYNKQTDSFFKFFMEPIMADMDDEEEEDVRYIDYRYKTLWPFISPFKLSAVFAVQRDTHYNTACSSLSCWVCGVCEVCSLMIRCDRNISSTSLLHIANGNMLTVGDERSLLIQLQEESAPYELNYEVDYEVALVLRNHIVPNAILWYTGEAVSDDEEDDEEGDEDFDPEDHDDNSSDNDDTTALTGSGATASGAAEPIDPAAGDADSSSSSSSGISSSGTSIHTAHSHTHKLRIKAAIHTTHAAVAAAVVVALAAVDHAASCCEHDRSFCDVAFKTRASGGSCEYDRAVSCECVNVCGTAAAAVGTAILQQNEFAVTMPHSQMTDLLFQTVAHCALCC
eukprot:13817-Heterococcus_DN1.PRE.1